MLTVSFSRANCRSQSTLYGRWSPRLFPIAGVLIAGLFTTFAEAQALHGRVVGVTDGDTIAVQDSDRLTHKVRLSGIDAPESRQAFGKRSKESLSRLVFGKPVRVAWTKKDRYGRIVGQVWVQPLDCPTCGLTLDANRTQLAVGMAWWFKRYADEQPLPERLAYEQEELDARARRVGLWSDPAPIAPWDWRSGVRTGN